MEALLDQLKSEGNIVTAKDMARIRKSPRYVSYLEKKDIVTKVLPGVYSLGDNFPDMRFAIHKKYPKVVFFGSDCLDLHGLSNWMPDKYQIALPYNYMTRGIVYCKATHFNGKRYSLGIIYKKDDWGNLLPTYDLERIIVELVKGDCFRLDAEQYEWVFNHLDRNKINFKKIEKYAKVISSKPSSLLEKIENICKRQID